MRQSFNGTSFVYGVIVATILACGIGAAANGDRGPQYDAAEAGGGLQIVDHHRNKLFYYQRLDTGESTNFRLVETVDLGRTGKAVLEVQRHTK